MRLFLGIPLVDATAASLTRLTTRLRSKSGNLRWSEPESWHITLQFLGNTAPEQYDCLIARLAQLRSPPVPIRLAELGIFDRAGIFYAEVDLTPPLVTLQQRVVAATTVCGFEPEVRPFHPHITLARSKGESRSRDLSGLQSSTRTRPELPGFIAAQFFLYESHLSPAGSTYEVRERYPLSGRL